MFELRVSRRRRPDPASLILAAAGGAIATSAVTALRDNARRTRAKNRVTSAASHTADLMGKAARDAKNRASGAAASAKSLMRKDHASDDKLVARVRSRLGRIVTHPHAIQVSAQDGHVVLSGPILRPEVGHLLHELRRVRGVRSIEDRLEVHQHGNNVPSLQGPGRPPRAPELLQERWTPSLRVGAAVLGAAIATAGVVRVPQARVGGLGLAGLGSLLVARAVFDEPIRRFLGLGGTRRSVEVQKTITIDAPVDQVFAYFSNIERFPEFMDHVQKVTPTGDGRSHWKVRGPLGTSVEWDAEVTSYQRNHHIAWKTVDRALVKQAGIIRFEPALDGRGTRVDLHLCYNPIAGYVGHGIASLFKVDAKTSLDEDLLRLKSLLEEGKATAHGAEVTRDALEPGLSAGAVPPRATTPVEEQETQVQTEQPH